MKTKIVLLTIILLTFLIQIIAQVHPPGGGNSPIDGGIEILFAIAAFYSVIKVIKKRNPGD